MDMKFLRLQKYAFYFEKQALRFSFNTNSLVFLCLRPDFSVLCENEERQGHIISNKGTDARGITW